MIADVIDLLRCPVCGGELGVGTTTGVVRCPAGHSFDLARQGYLNLLGPTADPGTGDDAEMIAARERFLGAGHYRPLTEALVGAAVDELGDEDEASAGGPLPAPSTVIEAGAGTGHHLTAVLDAAGSQWRAVALDLSRPALRRAARSHPRVGAVACDVWQLWPLADRCAQLVLSVFSPRNPEQAARVLAPGGAAIVLTPAPDHLAEIGDELGLLGVEPGKLDRLDREMSPYFDLTRRREHIHSIELSSESLIDLVTMGPNARHQDREELERRLPRDSGSRVLTVAAVISRFRVRART